MSNKETIDGHPMAAGFGMIPIEEIRKLSGLEYLRGIRDCKYPAAAISRALQFRMTEVEEGMVTFIGVPSVDYMNPIGSVHGGWAATILDSSLACCVQTLCPVGYMSTSVELKVNFVRPIKPDTGRMTCRGTVVHPGRQIATSEAKLVDENGKLFAHGTQTCSVFKIP